MDGTLSVSMGNLDLERRSQEHFFPQINKVSRSQPDRLVTMPHFSWHSGPGLAKGKEASPCMGQAQAGRRCGGASLGAEERKCSALRILGRGTMSLSLHVRRWEDCFKFLLAPDMPTHVGEPWGLEALRATKGNGCAVKRMNKVTLCKFWDLSWVPVSRVSW